MRNITDTQIESLQKYADSLSPKFITLKAHTINKGNVTFYTSLDYVSGDNIDQLKNSIKICYELYFKK